eukprot:1276615-Pleurochrysis_carterae.AAC.1
MRRCTESNRIGQDAAFLKCTAMAVLGSVLQFRSQCKSTWKKDGEIGSARARWYELAADDMELEAWVDHHGGGALDVDD